METSDRIPAAVGEIEEGGGLLRTLFPELYREGVHRTRELLLYAAAFSLAILLARTHLAYGMYPFAIAYLASARRRVLPILCGALLGAFGIGVVGGVFAAAIAFVFVLRVVFSLPVHKRALLPTTAALFSEAPGLRVLGAALGGASLAVYELTVSGTEDFVLYFAAAAVLSPTVLSLLFVFSLEGDAFPSALAGRIGAEGGGRRALTELSLLSFLVSVAFALLPSYLFGLSLFGLFSSAAVLFTAKRFGAARAGAVGLLTGLLSGPSSAAVFALLGLLSGLFFPLGTGIGLLAGIAGSVGFAVYTSGLSGFLESAPEGVVAALLLLPILRGASSEEDAEQRKADRLRLREATRAAATAEGEQGGRLLRLGTALDELSALFHRLSSEERRPSVSEYFGECQRVCARYCATCSSRIRCWEQGDRVAEGAIFSVATRLHESGRITREELPSELRSGCPRIEEILDEIRDESAAMALSRHRGDRNEFLSLDYAMLGKLLRDAANADREEASEDAVASGALFPALPKGEPFTCSVALSRPRRVAIGAPRASLLEERREELHAAAEGALGIRLAPPRIAVAEYGGVLTMRGVARYSVAAARQSLPLVGSGDRLRHFQTPDGFFYAVLSDGMGTGEEAAATAEVSVEFLRTLLLAGCSRRAAVRMLNSLVRGRQAECSATVDMLIFDLLEGHAAFLKSGAAPSYIRRGGEVLRVKSHTLPLGIRKTPDAELLHVEVAEGDLVVLLSDGIFSEDGEDPAWLLRLLASENTDDLAALAGRIVAEAAARIAEPRDDITVGLFRIDEDTKVGENEDDL